MRRLILVIIAGFLIGSLLGAGILLLTSTPSGSRVESSGKALVGGPFTLVDQAGKTVTERDFRGKYMLVFFGFTHCPDICPTELQVMAASLDELGPKAEKVVPIFITLDPERDTPEVVADYVKNFDPRLVGLTGSPEAVAAAAKAYRVAYSKVKPEGRTDDQNYSVDHSALIYLMGPDGEYVTHFTFGTPASKMAETLRKHL